VAQVVRAEPGEAAFLARGHAALERATGFDLLALPDLAENESSEAWVAALELCRRRRSLLLLDPPSSLTSVKAAVAWIGARERLWDRNAACYLPWVTLGAGSALRALPPSGPVAGIIARTDAAAGPWASPSGSGAELRGIDGLAWQIGKAGQEVLNPLGLNALRSFPGRGDLVYGARLLASAAGEGEQRYLPVRRLVLALEDALTTQLGWSAAEANAEPLWSRLRTVCEDFLQQLWRLGALQGSRPAEAFLVRCDRTTMTPADLEEGRVGLLVGFAPLRPAEFIVLTLQQLARRPD